MHPHNAQTLSNELIKGFFLSIFFNQSSWAISSVFFEHFQACKVEGKNMKSKGKKYL